MLQHGEGKLFCIITDWQYDNRSLKGGDSCSIRAPCTRQDEWVLQVLPERAPISQESISSPNKYTPAFHCLSKFSISLQSNLLPVASKCQCQVPAWRICSSWEMPSQNAMQDLYSSSAEERARDSKMPMPRCVWTEIRWRSFWYRAQYTTEVSVPLTPTH